MNLTPASYGRGQESKYFDFIPVSADDSSVVGADHSGISGTLKKLFSSSSPGISQRGLKFREPPPPGVSSILYSLITTGDTYDLNASMEQLKKGGDSEIVRLRQELLKFSGFQNDHTRYAAVYLLGRLHDEALAPIFAEKLEDNNFDVRSCAARALASILGTFKLNPGADWGDFIRKAPPLLSALALSKDSLSPWSDTRMAITDNISHLNLMENAQKEAFLKNFNDPRVLMVIIANGNPGDITATRGLHSTEARRVFQRLKDLVKQNNKTVGDVLLDAKLDSYTRARALSRLNRYNFLGPELQSDPKLVQVLPKLLLESKDGLSDDEMFSVAALAWQKRGTDFAQSLLDYSGKKEGLEQKKALMFLMINSAHLSDMQKETVEGMTKDMIPKDFKERIAPGFYDHWPQEKLRAAVVFTQASHAEEFLLKIQGNGYRKIVDEHSKMERPKQTTDQDVGIDDFGFRHRVPRREPPPASLTKRHVELTANKAGKAIHIVMDILPSNSHGWAWDRIAVGKELDRYLQDPEYQVVGFRGHMGDDMLMMPGVSRSQNKVFIDLSCDSSLSSYAFLHKCKNCAYFGTTTTAEGAINNLFLQEAIEALAKKMDYQRMDGQFRKTMPQTIYRFTGDWSVAQMWRNMQAALRPAESLGVNDEDFRRLGERLRMFGRQ